MQHPFDAHKLRRTAVRIIKHKCELLGPPNIRLISCEADWALGQASLLDEGRWAEESEAEFYFHVEHPANSVGRLEIEIGWPVDSVAAILYEKGDVAFSLSQKGCRFWLDLSYLSGRSLALDIHTKLREPGIYTRIEHNAWQRRAGWYRTVEWPQTQIQAVLHYMLAAREVVRALDLGQLMASHDEGRIAILGFETNNPPHPDSPPHWHLIAEWPHFFGALAPHLYIDEQGRHIGNRASVNGTSAKANYKAGEWCCMRGRTGADLAAVLYTEDGALAITAPENPIYLLSYCHKSNCVYVLDADKQELGQLAAADDVENGKVTIAWRRCDAAPGSSLFKASYKQTLHYNPLTGLLMETTNHADME